MSETTEKIILDTLTRIEARLSMLEEKMLIIDNKVPSMENNIESIEARLERIEGDQKNIAQWVPVENSDIIKWTLQKT